MLGKLVELGLSNGESKVYISLIELGLSTSTIISRNANVSSSKINEILEKLIRKGLVSVIFKSTKKYYQALDPERIFDYLEEQKNLINEKKVIAQSILPQLRNLSKFNSQTNVEAFYGVRGVKSGYERLLSGSTPQSELKYLFPYEEINENFRFFYKIQFPYTKMLGTNRGIMTEKITLKKGIHKLIGNKNVRVVGFPVPGPVDILNNKIYITSWQSDPIGILIYSKEIFEFYDKYFESLWIIGNPFEKKDR